MARKSGLSTIEVSKRTSNRQPAIVIESAYMGGIADSPYVGLANSLGSIVGFDLYTVPGLMLTAQKMTVEANGAPTDDLYKIVTCSDGNIYLFGKTNGTVYKNASGTYTLLGTVAPATGAVGILDAIEFDGKLYYSMQNRLGQWDYTTAFSTRNDNFQTFANGNATYHPMLTILAVKTLYIGDGNNLAQWDNTTFVNNALVFTTDQVISALGSQVTDLLIGTIVSNNVPRSWVHRWDTWSITTSYNYPIPEVGVNAFLQAGDAEIIIQAGLSGNFYLLNGSIFQKQGKIPSNFPTLYSPTSQNQSFYPAVAVLDNIPLIGISNVTGNPTYEGVYAFGAHAINYPQVLTLPYPISTGNLSNVTIWSLAVQGNNLYVSWKDTTSGTVYGIDKLDYSNKYNGAFFETRIIKFSRIWLDNYNKIVIDYQTLPANTTINLSYDANWTGYIAYSGTDLFTDTDRNQIVGNLNPRAKTMRFKVSTTASGNNAPAIEDLVILPT